MQRSKMEVLSLMHPASLMTLEHHRLSGYPACAHRVKAQCPPVMAPIMIHVG